jgi:hypothetical protein
VRQVLPTRLTSLTRPTCPKFRETKVEDLYLAIGSDFDVRGLQVAMNDAFLVGGIEGIGNLLRDLERLVERKRRRGVLRPAAPDVSGTSADPPMCHV